MLRAQCSLIFQDEILYNNFIEPLRKSKELNSVIIRCLNAYYRDIRVRALVDEGVYLPDESDLPQDEAESANKSVQEMFNDIRSNFAMQDFILDSLDSSMQNGIQQATDILDMANSKAEEKGGMRAKQTSYGTVLIPMKKEEQENSAKSESHNVISNPDFNSLTKSVESGDIAGALLQLGSLVSNLYTVLGATPTTANVTDEKQGDISEAENSSMNSAVAQVPMGDDDISAEISMDDLSSADLPSDVVEEEVQQLDETAGAEDTVASANIGNGAKLLNQALQSAMGL